MQPMYYIGLDVHKRKISYCVKDSGGKVYAEGSLPAIRFDLDRWMKTLPGPWTAAMEATVFTGRRRTRRNYTRAPAKRVRRVFAFLTKTYHGSRKIRKGPCAEMNFRDYAVLPGVETI